MNGLCRRGTLLAASIAALVAGASQAAQISPISYDMPNGSGIASVSASNNYWDLNYSGVGSTTTDGAPLSGGLGDLTDGVIATQPWYAVENQAGSGPYVGWDLRGVLNPTISFHFAHSPIIRSISLWVDNSQGVDQPASIWIDGADTPFTPLVSLAGPGEIRLEGLNLTGGTHTIQLRQREYWVMVSEVTFDGAVPEPATWALMIGGFGLAGGMLRRRRPGEA